MSIRWTPEAANDLERIFDYIAEDSRSAAASVVRRIVQQLEQLNKFPLSGPPGRKLGTRELAFTSLPYLAIYRVVDAGVEIQRILHGAQQWPPED